MPPIPDVSIIVPVYNGERTLDSCVQSLLALNYPREHVELIFVNNASTDGTSAILTRYGDRVRVVFEKKGGPAAARNRGLREARHEIVAMTDADCVVDPNWLRFLIPWLENRSVGIVGGTILSKRPCNTIEQFGERIHDHHRAINVYEPPYVITMNWASRRSLVSQCCFFDDSFIRGEDVDLSYRIFQAGHKLNFSPEAIVYHSNEHTYSGLFHEGFLHGFYSVQVIKKHQILLATFGHRGINRGSYLTLLSSLKRSILGVQAADARCDFVFNSGKKVGKIVGSIRFRYVDL
jgi:glycosyltransferase involved in cell wall biosynthesis